MRRLLLAATALLLLAVAAPAGATEPIMPLSEVAPGMRCTGLTVVQGTTISSFDVEIVDVVAGDPISQQPLLLIRVSGPVVAESGIAEGFSGSPVICDGKIAGAVAYGTGDYGNQLGLATPIEEMLGEPVPTPPGVRVAPALLRRARPLKTPIAVSGVAKPVFAPFAAAAAKAGLDLVAVPAAPTGARFEIQALQPGSSAAVGLANGAITAGAVGTVTYVDGQKVYAFGHPYDGTGTRSLLLQDAWVYAVIDNPLGVEGAVSAKLAAPGHDVGTLVYDGRDGVTGLLGLLPPRVQLQIHTRNTATGASRLDTAQVADESGAGLPNGASPIDLVAPMAAAQAAYAALDGSPAAQTAEMCVRIHLRELPKPAGFCNRYVGAFGGADVTSGGAYIADLARALGDVDEYAFGTPHLTGVDVRLDVQPGLRQALLRSVSGPRTLRRGQTAHLTLHLQHYRGARFERTVTLKVPHGAPLGLQPLRITGTALEDPSRVDELRFALGGDEADDGGDSGPESYSALARQIAQLHRYDGVKARIGRGGVRPLYRDRGDRISGSATIAVRVTR